MSARRNAGIVCIVLAAGALLFGSGYLGKAFVDKNACDARPCSDETISEIRSQLTLGGVEVGIGIGLLVAGSVLMREVKKKKPKKK